jgi:hypothetical protein
MGNNPKVPTGSRGRPKGSPNKVTASIKAAFKEAFDEMGGAPALVKWGLANKTEFYKLVTKLIPTEITGENGKDLPTPSYTVMINGVKSDD